MVGLTRYHGDHTEAPVRTWSDTWLSPAFADWSIMDLLPRVQVPIIVLQGRDDQYGSPAQVDAIVAGVGGTATAGAWMIAGMRRIWIFRRYCWI